MKQKNYGVIYHLLFIFLSVAGYPQGLSAQETQGLIDKIDVAQEFKALNNDMNTARTQQVDVLSPNNFKIANTHLEGARKNLDKLNSLSREIHRQITTARDYLGQANSVANLSHKQMDEVVIARQQAITAGAPVYFVNDFQRADEQLLRLTADLEKKKTVNAQKTRATLKSTYSNLELRSIRHQNLAQAGLTILQAVKDGAKQYAPEKLDQVLKNYKEVSVYINDHRYDVDEIKSRSLAVNEEANQLLQTTRTIAEVRKNTGEPVTSVEDIISTKQSAVTSKSEVEKIKRIQKQFTPSEAEVYQDGDNLVMRLRGLKFPVSQAMLSDSNLRLLGKVQRVIKDLKSSEVLIEGHTDNIGSKEINDKISMLRAQTIKDYLVSLDAIGPSRVKVVGRGKEIPLASNQTPEGRAQNRRVDILIKL